MTKKDFLYMNRALDLAHEAFSQNEMPVGAILVDATSDSILAEGFNQVERYQDNLAHAEMVVLQKASKICLDPESNLILYVTLEPCLMCLGALTHCNVKKVVYAASSTKFGGYSLIAGSVSLPSIYHTRIPLLLQGPYQEEAQKLLNESFLCRRKL